MEKLNSTWKKLEQAGIQVGEDVELCGYFIARRDVSQNLAFTILRNNDQNLCIQLVSNSNDEGHSSLAHERIKSLKEWTPITIRGKVKQRKLSKNDTHLDVKLINTLEIEVTDVEILNEISDSLIMKTDTVFGPEERHLQLRTDSTLRQKLLTRARATHLARNELTEDGWTEVETPLLFKSTPEGAREFLVPTRTQGLTYALPQSPQQYKQILMASGISKYFQFAKCFRDEDLRADRQPEFTQLDMEMSFANEEDVMAVTEKVLKRIWSEVRGWNDPAAFQRMTYHDAMSLYGSDKPDLRYEAKVNRS